MNIIHVGHTRTQGDLWRVCKVLEWLRTSKVDIHTMESFFVDLNKKQDFLEMVSKWDIVVLHYICRDQVRCFKTTPDPMRVSPHASWERWRKRLVETEAKYIFAFGGFGEVSGPYLLTLDGYKAIEIDKDDMMGLKQGMWVFAKV